MCVCACVIKHSAPLGQISSAVRVTEGSLGVTSIWWYLKLSALNEVIEESKKGGGGAVDGHGGLSPRIPDV